MLNRARAATTRPDSVDPDDALNARADQSREAVASGAYDDPTEPGARERTALSSLSASIRAHANSCKTNRVFLVRQQDVEPLIGIYFEVPLCISFGRYCSSRPERLSPASETSAGFARNVC